MKAEKFSEALECYTRAIRLDNTNAVYYCNRFDSLLSPFSVCLWISFTWFMSELVQGLIYGYF